MQGLQNEQLMKLLTVLKTANSEIQALNLGESPDVSMEMWRNFATALHDTNVGYLYVSDHNLHPGLKNDMKKTIKKNRKR
jgi:hypothetical protein